MQIKVLLSGKRDSVQIIFPSLEEKGAFVTKIKKECRDPSSKDFLISKRIRFNVKPFSLLKSGVDSISIFNNFEGYRVDENASEGIERSVLINMLLLPPAIKNFLVANLNFNSTNGFKMQEDGIIFPTIKHKTLEIEVTSFALPVDADDLNSACKYSGPSSST